MGHVFISYSRKDQEHARQLTEDLRQHGFDVWIDDRIDYGERWMTVIFQAIRDASAVVVIMSPDSEKSEWVEREYLYARNQSKLLLPLMLNGHIFPYFVNLQVGTFTENGGLPDDFYARLEHVTTPKDSTGQIIVAPPPPKTPEIKPAPIKIRQTWLAGAGVGIVVLVLAGVLFLSGVLNGDDNKGGGETNQATNPPTDILTDMPTQEASIEVAAQSNTATQTLSPSFTVTKTNASTPTETSTTQPSNTPSLTATDMFTASPTMTDTVTPIPSSTPNPTVAPTLNSAGLGIIAFIRDSDIYVMSADGSQANNLTRSAGNDYDPAWSPDGTRIAFVSSRNGNDEIYVMNSDGSEVINLTQNERDDRFPQWSPDGTQIASNLIVMAIGRSM